MHYDSQMSTKTAVWMGTLIGSTIGSLIPMIWNGGAFSYILWGGIGAIAGIWCGFKLTN